MTLADDRYKVLGFVDALCPDSEALRAVVVDGDPPSKARARFNSRGQIYTPKVTIQGEKRYAAVFDGIRFTGNVAVACLFYRKTYQRIDVDNLLKAVLDAGTRAKVWVDDSQVTALIGLIEHDADYPRAVIAFGEHASSMKRGTSAMRDCEACGKPFLPTGAQRRANGRWCSRECRTVLAEPVPCARCGEPFKRRSGNQKFCSNACRLNVLHAANGPGPQPCEVCGEPTSKAGYRRCRSCFLGGQLPLEEVTS